MSYHLLDDFEMANSILETFRTSQSVESFDYKHSEFLLYQNQVIQESDDFEKALKHLEEHQGQILDKIAVKETLGKLSLKLKYFDKAISIFMDLIRRNPDNSEYFKHYLEARQTNDSEAIIGFYKEMSQEFPSSLCVKRLPLDVASGDVFEELITEYLKRNLRKGVPPLFVNIRSLYKDPQKIATIERLTLEFVTNLNSSGHFTKDDFSNGVPQEPASALLWTYYYLAQHFDHLKIPTRALEFVNLAIDHTPTLIELFVIKGKIYKHAGDVEEAYKWLDEAQSLDTADRYINSKCAKYMLRANKMKEAEEMCAKFTRDGVSAMENLNEMQCMWFQTESALAYQRMGQWGESLKKCHEIERHFSEIVEDQFDFHTYCVRKMTLRSYVDLLRLETRLRDHPFYFRAAKCAIEVSVDIATCSCALIDANWFDLI
jgi:tetratricopeptide (TPR) repeat protein